MAFPLFRRKPGILGSSDPRASYWGRYRYRDGSLGGEVRIPGPEVKVIVGKNSAGKGRGLILPNLLKRTGISQLTVDTRCAAGAVSGPWRRTVDEKQVVANPYGCLDNDPDYADLQGVTGINLLEAPELDPDSVLVFDHLNVMSETCFPAENAHQPFFDLSSQSLFVALAWGEMREAKDRSRKPLLANVRRRALERSEFDRKTGEPVAGLAKHVADLMAYNNPIVNASIGCFAGPIDETIANTLKNFEAKSRWMMSPMLAADEQRGGIDFGEMGRRVTSAYLAVPAEHVAACAPWLKLAITGALRPLFTVHEIPVTFWLDEFYALKRLPLIDQIGVVAGNKIEIIVVVQSLTMLKQLYGEVWEAFVGNASVIALVGACPDKFTCEYLMALSGKTSMAKPTTNYSNNPGGTGAGGGWGFETVPTLTEAALYGLAPGTGFVWIGGLADPTPVAYPGWYTDPVLSQRGRRDPWASRW